MTISLQGNLWNTEAHKAIDVFYVTEGGKKSDGATAEAAVAS